MQKKKGFTLVELLAVIVILAVILVIAVPQIMSVIESARKGSIESTAKLIAEGAEREYTNRKILGKDTNIECSDVSSMNSNDYGTCVITFDNAGKATVKVTGKGKFEGYTCNGNSTNVECVKGEIPGSTETAVQYFGYEENAIDEVIVKDKDKCITFLKTNIYPEDDANTICSGNKLKKDDWTLRDDVLQGNIPSSDYETAGLEVTYGTYITGYNIEGGLDVVIPSMINGKKVVGIADNAFTSAGVTPTTISNTKKESASYLYNKDRITTTPLVSGPTISGLGITSVVIPSTIKSIGDSAFYDNKLTEVTIPNSVTSIGTSAFGNNQLTEAIIPGSVTSIGYYAFKDNKLTEITIPSSVTSIGYMAFYGNQLTSITLSEGVESIGSYAFYGNQLTEVVIPSSVTSIGRCAFSKTNSSNQNLSKIVNKTGKSFEWGNIISYGGSAVYNFITGTVPNNYGDVEVVSE